MKTKTEQKIATIALVSGFAVGNIAIFSSEKGEQKLTKETYDNFLLSHKHMLLGTVKEVRIISEIWNLETLRINIERVNSTTDLYRVRLSEPLLTIGKNAPKIMVKNIGVLKRR